MRRRRSPVPLSVVKGAIRKVEQPPVPAPDAGPTTPAAFVGRELDLGTPFVLVDGKILAATREALGALLDLLDPGRIAPQPEAQARAKETRDHVLKLRAAVETAMANNIVAFRRMMNGAESTEGMTLQ